MRKIVFLIMILLSGCSAMNDQVINRKPLPVIFEGKAVEVREVKDLLTIKDDLEKIPDYNIEMQFYKDIKILDFANALSHGLPDISIMIDFFSPEQKIIVPKFKGKLKDLFKLLQEAYGYSYYVEGKNIIIKDNSQVILKVPSVISNDERNIKDMFSIFEVLPDDIHIDYGRGVVVAIMDNGQYKRLKQYLHDYGIYQYQIDIVVIEDTSNRTDTVGIDLAQISAVLSDQMPVGNINAIGNTLSLITGNPTSQLTVGAAKIINLSAVIAAYDSVNEIRLDQRIRMGVLGGSVAHVDLSRKVPYVASITAVAGAVGQQATNGYTFETAQDGIVIDIKPSGDDESINIDTSINYEQITSYLNVGVGSYAISRPIVQARSYKSQFCMRPGDISLIGSLRVLDDESTQSGLLNKLTYSNKSKLNRDLSILMGVSVIKYKMI